MFGVSDWLVVISSESKIMKAPLESNLKVRRAKRVRMGADYLISFIQIDRYKVGNPRLDPQLSALIVLQVKVTLAASDKNEQSCLCIPFPPASA